jgi:heme/copper-type cytochrome/quinol oxidase subunit 1
MEWFEIIVGIIAGLVVLIPLGIKLFNWLKNIINEKKWPELIEVVLKLITEAETAYPDGASCKENVMQMVKSTAAAMDYDVDMAEISKFIDNVVAMAKLVNAKKK